MRAYLSAHLAQARQLLSKMKILPSRVKVNQATGGKPLYLLRANVVWAGFGRRRWNCLIIKPQTPHFARSGRVKRRAERANTDHQSC